jgi:cytochrome P450
MENPGASPADASFEACPRIADRDERKSARLAAQNLEAPPGAQVVTSFAFARELLRSTAMRQAIELGADRFDLSDPAASPVIFLDGEPHRRKRAAIAKYFTPKAVETQHRAVMERVADELLAELRAKGRGRLDVISFELAVAVAAEIVGLTNSDRAAMARRIASSFKTGTMRLPRSLRKAAANAVAALKLLRFFYFDVRPAIRARRKARRDDVISQLLDQGASEQAIMIECTVYASAGMVTTREFIVMAAWHLFERPDLRRRFVEGDERSQVALLEEILRLEPIAGMLWRKAAEDVGESTGGPLKAGARFVIDVRAANSEAAVVGPCPHAIDPDRQGRAAGALLSFGDGPHRCPGAQVAMHETRIFLDRLMRLPGLRLERAPDMVWNGSLMSYELRDALIACDR